MQDKSELHGGILEAFRDESYELLGQVIAGFYRVPARVEEGRGVLALTVQAAASRPARGRQRVGLNLIGRTPAGESLDLLWERQDELPWRRAVRWAQSALGTLDRSHATRGASRAGSTGSSEASPGDSSVTTGPAGAEHGTPSSVTARASARRARRSTTRARPARTR